MDSVDVGNLLKTPSAARYVGTTKQNLRRRAMSGRSPQPVRREGRGAGGGNFAKGVSAEVGEEEAAIDLTMAIEYGQSIPQLTEAARRNVINRIESLVGLRVTEVNITVNDVQVPEERPMLGQQEEVERQARQQEQRA